MSKEESNWLPTNADVEQYELLREMLNSQKKEFDLLSKKKADGPLNPMKIKMVNRVLIPLKELLIHEKSNIFLDILDDDDIPSNSDVVLIISQYITAISNFKSRHYHYNGHEHEWKTSDNGYSIDED